MIEPNEDAVSAALAEMRAHAEALATHNGAMGVSARIMLAAFDPLIRAVLFEMGRDNADVDLVLEGLRATFVNVVGTIIESSKAPAGARVRLATEHYQACLAIQIRGFAGEFETKPALIPVTERSTQ